MRSTFIARHNKTILKNHERQNETNKIRDCNCRHNRQCPIQGKCLQTNVVHKADKMTTDNNDTKTYIGVISDDFENDKAGERRKLLEDKMNKQKSRYIATKVFDGTLSTE